MELEESKKDMPDLGDKKSYAGIPEADFVVITLSFYFNNALNIFYNLKKIL